MEFAQEYAIAGSYKEFLDWTDRRKERRRITYLTRQLAETLLKQGARRIKVHRIGMWERSEARELAEKLEV